MSGKARCWLVTVNNPSAWLDPADWQYIKFAVWQLEMGDNGTVHYQMYVNFSEPMSHAALHKLDGLEHSHTETRRGTKLEAVTYCSKDESRLEGPFWYPDERSVKRHAASEKGKRTDLDSLCEMIEREYTDAQIAEVAPILIVKYQRGADHLRLALQRPGRTGETIDSIVYVGPSGTGKSRRLRLECPEGDLWFWVSPGKWFDGYQGQPGLVFDEFRDTWYTYSYFLKLVDIYPFRVEKKSGSIVMKATRFRFSTNVHPKSWWSGRPGKLPWLEDPLRRRLQRIELMNEPFNAQMEIVDTAGEWWDTQPAAVDPAVRAVYGQRMND